MLSNARLLKCGSLVAIYFLHLQFFIIAPDTKITVFGFIIFYNSVHSIIKRCPLKQIIETDKIIMACCGTDYWQCGHIKLISPVKLFSI